LNWRLAAAEHGYILQDCGAAVLVCEEDFRENAERNRAVVPDCEFVAHGFSAKGWSGFEELLESNENLADNPDVTYESLLLIIYTSGTTGRPKGAVLTQNALFWNALNSVHMHDLSAQDHVLSVLPLFHVGPLNIQTVPAFYTGATVTLTPKFDPGTDAEIDCRSASFINFTGSGYNAGCFAECKLGKMRLLQFTFGNNRIFCDSC
jgi:fatty-acyl-CoA synthase